MGVSCSVPPACWLASLGVWTKNYGCAHRSRRADFPPTLRSRVHFSSEKLGDPWFGRMHWDWGGCVLGAPYLINKGNIRVVLTDQHLIPPLPFGVTWWNWIIASFAASVSGIIGGVIKHLHTPGSFS